MRTITYPDRHALAHAMYTGGTFWVVTYLADFPYYQATELTLTASDGTVRVLTLPAKGPYYNQHMPTYIDHPVKPGLSAAWFTDKESTALHIETGKTFTVTKDKLPVHTYHGGTATNADVHAFRAKHVTPYQITAHAHTRCSYDDATVVMTGAYAVSNAGVVMGPTTARGVLGTRGLRNNRVVCYTRGGSVRVMRLPGRSNPTHVQLSDDGLTYLAACRYSAYVLDVDSGN